MPYPLNASPVNYTRPTKVWRFRADGDVGRTVKTWTRVWNPAEMQMHGNFTARLAYMQVHGGLTPPQPTLPGSGGGGAAVPTTGQIWPRGQ